MILPTKHLRAESSLIGIGSMLLPHLTRAKTISTLWDAVKENPYVGSYERFLLALNFLYMIDLIESKNGLLKRVRHD